MPPNEVHVAARSPIRAILYGIWIHFAEHKLIQTQMAQKPMLRAEVYAHAPRASRNCKKEVGREKEVLYPAPTFLLFRLKNHGDCDIKEFEETRDTK